MNPQVTAENNGLIVSLDELKNWLRYTHTTAEDALITGTALALQYMLEGKLNRRLLTTTQVFKMAQWKETFKLPYGAPFQEVVSFKYYDDSNTLQDVPTGFYRVYDHFEPPRVELTDYPSIYDRDDAIQITYKSGYSAASGVPGTVKLWLRVRLTDYFIMRQSKIVGATISVVEDPDDILLNDRIIEL